MLLAVPLLDRPALDAAVAASLRNAVAGLPLNEPLPILEARLELVPLALAQYEIAVRFEEPGGKLLHEVNTQDACVLNGVLGQPLDPQAAAFVAAQRLALASLPQPVPDATVVPFRLDARQLRENMISILVAQHTRRVAYTGANGRTYERTCKPARKDIVFANGPVLLHHPRWTVRVGIRAQVVEIEAYQAAPDTAGAVLWVTRHTLPGLHFCPGCGLLLAPPQLVACAACGKRVCAKCALHKSRLGIFRKHFCNRTCAEAFAARGSVLGWM
jgi:hypothetical protein